MNTTNIESVEGVKNEVESSNKELSLSDLFEPHIPNDFDNNLFSNFEQNSRENRPKLTHLEEEIKEQINSVLDLEPHVILFERSPTSENLRAADIIIERILKTVIDKLEVYEVDEDLTYEQMIENINKHKGSITIDEVD